MNTFGDLSTGSLSLIKNNALVAQLVERGFCKADVASSSLVGGSEFITPIMSLISQQDRTLAIKALEHYTASFKDIMSEAERAESNALLNWIKLEYYKNEH